MRAKKSKTKSEFKPKKTFDQKIKRKYVKFDDLVPFKGNIDKFLKQITEERRGYVAKWGETIHLYWVDDEKWFCNWVYQQGKLYYQGGWIIAKDLPSMIQGYINHGSKMCFLKEKEG